MQTLHKKTLIMVNSNIQLPWPTISLGLVYHSVEQSHSHLTNDLSTDELTRLIAQYSSSLRARILASPGRQGFWAHS